VLRLRKFALSRIKLLEIIKVLHLSDLKILPPGMKLVKSLTKQNSPAEPLA